MEVILSARGVGDCGRTALKKGYFDGMVFVDSAGNRVDVANIGDVRPANPFWVWPFEWLMLESRTYRVELELSDPVPISLDDFKAKIIEYIDLERRMWESGIGVGAIKAQVRAAKSHREAIEIIYGRKID